MHRHGCGGPGVDGARRAELLDVQDHLAGLTHLVREPGALLPEHQDALSRQVVGLQRHRAGEVVDADERYGARAPLVVPARGPGPGDEVLDGRVVVLVLVAVGHHRPAAVPPALADDVEGLGVEGVRRADDRADVEVVAPVLDRDVEVVPVGVEVGHDRVVPPVAVGVDDVAPVAVAQQLRVPVVTTRPLADPRPDPDLLDPDVLAHAPTLGVTRTSKSRCRPAARSGAMDRYAHQTTDRRNRCELPSRTARYPPTEWM